MIVNQADTAVDGPARQSQSEEQAKKSHEGAGSVQQQEGSGSRRESDAALASHKETTAAPKAGLLSYMLDPNDVDDSQGFEPFEHEEDEVVRNVSESTLANVRMHWQSPSRRVSRYFCVLVRTETGTGHQK
jgi:hypothetical protein